MPRLRGNGFINIRAWVTEHQGAAAWDDLLTSLDPADQAALRELRPAAWYPLSLQARLLRRIDARWGDDDLRLARAIGRDQALRDMDRGVLTWLFRLFPPSVLVANMDVVWRRFHDSGRWTAVTRDGVTTVTVYDWQSDDPANCMDVEGYIEYLAQRMSRTPGSFRHTRCRLRGAEACEFVYDEPLDGRIVVPRAVPDLDDVVAIGRELLQVGTPDAVVDAIVTVVRNALPREASAALWGWDGATGQARMLWSRGVPTDQPAHCFVLESAGRTYARLEIEALRGPRRGEILAALESLTPWFGMALAGAEAGGSHTLPTELPSAPRDDVGRAASRWRLTPRQVDVLRGIIEGKTNKEIAAALGCAEATVEVHVTALYRRSGLANRTGLVRAVLGAESV